ncbi:MAG: arylsulfatase A-like enzyme [Pirellulaceae bacterium]|jgi:arylsulfatase A-like enzyme
MVGLRTNQVILSCDTIMNHTKISLLCVVTYVFALCLMPLTVSAEEAKKPNIIYLMSDELGYFELSCMGNKNFQTPNIDRLASEGVRFTQALAGAPVCAPTRCVLMTGKHLGHTSVRSNGGSAPMRQDEETIASVLKKAGYATGGFGKWGVGGRGSSGVPEQHGFDTFVGYYDQVHAHSYYPPYLVKNSEELPLKGNKGGSVGETYSQYVIYDAAKKFIRDNKDQPFFCYLPFTPPHGIFDIPDDDPSWAIYKDKDWPNEAKRYAAMVNMIDREVGEIVGLLKELKLDENTIFFFCGDNGGNDYFRTGDRPRGFHGPNVNPATGVAFRGHKGNLYEGGLRIPMIVRWPGKIEAGRVSDQLWYFPDVLPTVAEIAGATAPKDIDGISIVPELIGEKAAGRAQEDHDYLYWEFGNQIAVRKENWKAVMTRSNGKWELYDLTEDITEENDVSADEPELMAEITKFAKSAHEPERTGTFSTRDLNEKDRWAKFGTSRPQPKPQKTQQLDPKGLISNKIWKIVSASSEAAGNGRLAKSAIDGKPQTHWHSDWSKKLPHELVIDLGAEHQIRGFRYLARQDGGWNGALKKCEFYVSNSADAFGDKPTVATEFKKIKTSQEVKCEPTTGRYIRVRVLSEVNGNAYGSISELGVVGK